MTAPTRGTVLVVDDDVAVAAAIRRSLVEAGYAAFACADPREALVVLGVKPIDVIVTDNDMPGMTGIDLLSEVKRSRPEIARILITGRGSMEAAIAAINRGEVFRFLTKPWVDDDLVSAVSEAIDRLVELRRTAAADLGAERRRRALAELEREHPGVGDVGYDETGAYVVDEDAGRDLRMVLGL